MVFVTLRFRKLFRRNGFWKRILSIGSIQLLSAFPLTDAIFENYRLLLTRIEFRVYCQSIVNRMACVVLCYTAVRFGADIRICEWKSPNSCGGRIQFGLVLSVHVNLIPMPHIR